MAMTLKEAVKIVFTAEGDLEERKNEIESEIEDLEHDLSELNEELEEIKDRLDDVSDYGDDELKEAQEIYDAAIGELSRLENSITLSEKDGLFKISKTLKDQLGVAKKQIKDMEWEATK
jgi:F0F1-type ATP synthase membrane subunit b/b'